MPWFVGLLVVATRFGCGGSEGGGDAASADARDVDAASGVDAAPPIDGLPADGPGGDDATGTGADFRSAGPYEVDTSTSSHVAASGCSLEYERYVARDAPEAPLIVLAHGLECTRANMVNVARHYASWGFAVVAPDLCHSTVLDLDQEQNGLDMVDLASDQTSGGGLYVGHSAGGLAAFVAADADPDAVAVFGLDPADWNTIGTTLAPDLQVSAFGLIGVPHSCNGQNNAIGLYAAAPGGRVLRVTEADHCDFSSPSDCVACNLACGAVPGVLFSDAEIERTILGMSTAYLRWQASLDASGANWWSPGGTNYEALLAAGAISEIE